MYGKGVRNMENEEITLRHFTDGDLDALFEIFGNDEINQFLPWFTLNNKEEAVAFYEARFKVKGKPFYNYAICLKETNHPIGYITVSNDGAYDLGYGLLKDYWGKGYVTAACQFVINKLKQDGVAFITATHDVHNVKSGQVMRRLGMRYCYSYDELVKPKNHEVRFRMYQLDLNGKHPDYSKYWKINGNKTIENI